MDAQGVIHFIGLVLFTTQVSGLSSQVVAIMPKVDSGHQPTSATSPRGARQDIDGRRIDTIYVDEPAPPGGVTPRPRAQVPAANRVEDHVALMAFKPCDLVAVSGWEVKKLDDQFLYIRLDGEKIDFVADGTNNRATMPLMGHVGGAKLRPEYSPGAYPGASAVFFIPNGTVSSCMATNVPGRLDTLLTLGNHGTFTIKTAGKSITFNGNAGVVLMNVPWLWALRHQATQTGPPHYTVYCAMTGDTVCDAHKIVPNNLNGISQCTGGANWRIAGGASDIASKVQVPEYTRTVDMYCSTTSWP